MALAAGTSLDSAWPGVSEDARVVTLPASSNPISSSYAAYRAQNPGWIGSCTGTAAYDHRLNNGFPCGPFVSASQLHDFLGEPISKCPKEMFYESPAIIVRTICLVAPSHKALPGDKKDWALNMIGFCMTSLYSWNGDFFKFESSKLN
jgi:hypothetical protein